MERYSLTWQGKDARVLYVDKNGDFVKHEDIVSMLIVLGREDADLRELSEEEAIEIIEAY